MLILGANEKFDSPCALVLGGFDGLHLGHRALLARAWESGLPVGITTIFGGKGKELFTREEREFLFSHNGLHFVLEFPFTPAFRNTSAEGFLHDIFGRIDARFLVCGEDFRFGRDAEGTAELLRALAPCPVFVQTAVTGPSRESGQAKLSASVCKEWLKEGDLPRLNACLFARKEEFYGGAYFIGGIVEHGREVGRTYGFPTLNLSVPQNKLLPPDGVYRGMCSTPAGNFPTIIHIGARPTFRVEERKIEAYLDGFSGDLYGEPVRVYPTEFLRPVVRFPSAEALKEQLQRDIGRLRAE